MADLIMKDNVLDTEYMMSVVVVVPKASMKDFETTYTSMAQWVVPASANLISEDSEYGLYTVVIFKKSYDEFKIASREKRLTIREFVYDPNMIENDKAKKLADTREYERLKGMLAKWCEAIYAEVYIMTLHLKAVRIFCESVLRYGLTTSYGAGMAPNFKAFLLQPKKGAGEKLRKVLATLYAGAGAGAGEDEAEQVVPGAVGEFFPYVYAAIETEPNIAA